MTELSVWRDSALVGWLSKTRPGLRFRFSPEYVEASGVGLPIVSMSLPTSLRPYSDAAARPFFDGLLPEGEARRIIAYDATLPEKDTFGLLELLGRDCAGALSIVVDGDVPPVSGSAHSLVPLERRKIDDLIANLRFQPLGVGGEIRVSLGGVQEKLLLTKMGSDRWALPTAEVASTHILKPALTNIEHNVINELICLRFAQQLGVPAANVSTDTFSGRATLIVERFDRKTHEPTGVVSRMHQETACQALAVPVGSTTNKYEDSGGPSWAAVAKVLGRWGSPDQLDELFRQLVVHVLVGNSDCHAMNISFVLGVSGVVAVSPMYDVFSTLFYPQFTTTPGMFIGGSRDLRAVGRGELLTEALKWGVDAKRAKVVLDSLCESAPTALAACLQDEDVPDELAAFLTRRVEAVSKSGLR